MMALRSGLYPYLPLPPTHQVDKARKKLTLVIFAINFDVSLIIDKKFPIKIFSEEEIDRWFDYITSGINDIYLFLSNMVSNTFIQSICEYPQINSIYLFCKDPQDQNSSSFNRKFRGFFHDFETMFHQFQNDINELVEEGDFKQSTFQIIDRKSNEILWWKYFHEILPYIRPTDIAKEEFISFAREVFRHDGCMIENITKFQINYSSDQVIHWYTRDTFVYRLVNKTLRTKKFKNIFKLRFFLTDLISALKLVHSNRNDQNNSLIMYRGQQMSLEEVELLRLNIGNLISTNAYLSSSACFNVARSFAKASADHYCDEHASFTIEIDPSEIDATTAPFGEISNISLFPDEREILFSMYSTFQVRSVQLIRPDFYQIDLKLVNNPWHTDSDEKCIFNPFTDEIFTGNPSKGSKLHIGFQVFLDMILRSGPTVYGKQELFQYCRLKYQHDPRELQNINRFEEQYQSKDAIERYLTEKFLYRLLNPPNGSDFIDAIVKMRYFIYDLHNQFIRLQPSFIQSLNGEQYLTLYRGRTMRTNRFDELQKNIRGLMSIKSFLSATQNKHSALAFLRPNPDEVSVLYEICINTNIQSVPYAKIQNVPYNGEEILFSMGSIFRIQDIYRRQTREYCVKLIMEHIGDELWKRLTGHLD